MRFDAIWPPVLPKPISPTFAAEEEEERDLVTDAKPKAELEERIKSLLLMTSRCIGPLLFRFLFLTLSLNNNRSSCTDNCDVKVNEELN